MIDFWNFADWDNLNEIQKLQVEGKFVAFVGNLWEDVLALG